MRDRDWNDYRERSRRHDDDYDRNERGSGHRGGDYGETGRGFSGYGREEYGRGERGGSPRGRESDYGRRMYREDAGNWDLGGRSGSGSSYGDEYERRRPGQYGDRGRREYDYGQGANYGGGYGQSMGRGSERGVGSSGAYGESMGRGSEYDRGSSAGGYGTDYGRYGGISRMSGAIGEEPHRSGRYDQGRDRSSRYDDRDRDRRDYEPRSGFGSYDPYRGEEERYGRGDDRGSYGQGTGRSNARLQGGGNYQDEWYSAEGEHGPNYERRTAFDKQAGRDLGYGDSQSGRYNRRR